MYDHKVKQVLQECIGKMSKQLCYVMLDTISLNTDEFFTKNATCFHVSNNRFDNKNSACHKFFQKKSVSRTILFSFIKAHISQIHSFSWKNISILKIPLCSYIEDVRRILLYFEKSHLKSFRQVVQYFIQKTTMHS